VIETKTNKAKFNRYIKLSNICCAGLLTSQSLWQKGKWFKKWKNSKHCNL